MLLENSAKIHDRWDRRS